MAENGGRSKLRCAMDHVLEAEKNGEISSENVIYIVENINVAGNYIISNFDFKLCNLIF